MNDTAVRQQTPVIFKVYGDTKLRWASKPLQRGGNSQASSITMEGAEVVTLVVECHGPIGHADAV